MSSPSICMPSDPVTCTSSFAEGLVTLVPIPTLCVTPSMTICLALLLLEFVKLRSPDENSFQIKDLCAPLKRKLKPEVPVVALAWTRESIEVYLIKLPTCVQSEEPDPPAPQDTLPAPSVVRNWPAVPSTLGRV